MRNNKDEETYFTSDVQNKCSHQFVNESRNAWFFPVIVRMQKNRQDLSLYVSNSTIKLSHSFSSFYNTGWCTVWCASHNNFVTPRGYSYFFLISHDATHQLLEELETLSLLLVGVAYRYLLFCYRRAAPSLVLPQFVFFCP